MRAAVVTEYGSPIEIVEIDPPELLADSVMVEVHASSVNPIGSAIRQGYMTSLLPYELPWTIGYDVSGIVTEIGSDVTTLEVSDAVFGRADGMQAGTMAEFAMIKASDLAIKPSNISHTEAAGVPLAGLTAWQALVDHGHLERGQKVLIHAGSGGVGTLAIQIAKHLGAFVATTVSSDNVQMVKDLGADVVIDYKSQSFEEELSGYDLVLDMLGGETLDRSFEVLATGGTLVTIKGEPSQATAAQFGVTAVGFFMSPSGEQLTRLADLITKDQLHPIADRTFSLDETQAAFEHSEAGHARGKIIVQVR